jgi:hypothetical protein
MPPNTRPLEMLKDHTGCTYAEGFECPIFTSYSYISFYPLLTFSDFMLFIPLRKLLDIHSANRLEGTF